MIQLELFRAIVVKKAQICSDIIVPLALCKKKTYKAVWNAQIYTLSLSVTFWMKTKPIQSAFVRETQKYTPLTHLLVVLYNAQYRKNPSASGRQDFALSKTEPLQHLCPFNVRISAQLLICNVISDCIAVC